MRHILNKRISFRAASFKFTGRLAYYKKNIQSQNNASKSFKTYHLVLTATTILNLSKNDFVSFIWLQQNEKKEKKFIHSSS